MAIDGVQKGTILLDVENANTSEDSFRTGASHMIDQIDGTQILLDTELGDITGNIDVQRSARLRMLGNIPDSEVDRVNNRVSTNAGVTEINGSGSVTLSSGYVTVFHTGTGTVTITVDANTPDGAAFYVASEGTLTMAYTGATNHRGISLGNATKLASGAYSDTNNALYFSETVY